MNKQMIPLIFAGLLAAPASAIQADDFSTFNKQLEKMCHHEYATIEHGRACETGGIMAYGAPRSAALADYLALLDQCIATYQDARSDFGPAISAAELRAACQTGLVWTRTIIAKPKG